MTIKFRLDRLKGVATAGRLGIEFQGLIVFTQDGRIAREPEVSHYGRSHIRALPSPVARIRRG